MKYLCLCDGCLNEDYVLIGERVFCQTCEKSPLIHSSGVNTIAVLSSIIFISKSTPKSLL